MATSASFASRESRPAQGSNIASMYLSIVSCHERCRSSRQSRSDCPSDSGFLGRGQVVVLSSREEDEYASGFQRLPVA